MSTMPKIGDRVKILRGTHAGKSGTVVDFDEASHMPLKLEIDAGPGYANWFHPNEVEPISPPEPVSETTSELKIGDWVKVVKGEFAGTEGEILHARDSGSLYVNAADFGLWFSPDELELADRPEPVSETSADDGIEILTKAALALWGIDISVAPAHRSLEPVEMQQLHDYLVSAGELDPEPEFTSDPELDYIVKVDGVIVARFRSGEEAASYTTGLKRQGVFESSVTVERG